MKTPTRRVFIPGEKINRLTAISRDGPFGLYQCECGNEHRARVKHVWYGQTKSCGCLLDRSYTKTYRGKPKHGSIKHGGRKLKTNAKIITKKILTSEQILRRALYLFNRDPTNHQKFLHLKRVKIFYEADHPTCIHASDKIHQLYAEDPAGYGPERPRHWKNKGPNRYFRIKTRPRM